MDNRRFSIGIFISIIVAIACGVLVYGCQPPSSLTESNVIGTWHTDKMPFPGELDKTVSGDLYILPDHTLFFEAVDTEAERGGDDDVSYSAANVWKLEDNRLVIGDKGNRSSAKLGPDGHSLIESIEESYNPYIASGANVTWTKTSETTSNLPSASKLIGKWSTDFGYVLTVNPDGTWSHASKSGDDRYPYSTIWMTSYDSMGSLRDWLYLGIDDNVSDQDGQANYYRGGLYLSEDGLSLENYDTYTKI